MHTLKTLVNEEEAFSLLKRFLLLQKKSLLITTRTVEKEKINEWSAEVWEGKPRVFCEISFSQGLFPPRIF